MRYNDNPTYQRHAACLVLLISVCLAALGGCAAERTVREQRLIREHLVELYEDQIRDNLVRIKTGRAFVHVNYSNLQGKTRDQVLGKIYSGSQSTEVSGANNIIIEGPGSSDITVGGEVTLWDEISVSGEPVIGNATVYDAYVLFAEQFVKDHSAQKEGHRHLWERSFKEEDGTTKKYCVPIPRQETSRKTNGSKKAYERLIWLTTLDQGKTAKVQEVIVTSVTLDLKNGSVGNLQRYEIELHPKQVSAKLAFGTLCSSRGDGHSYRVFSEVDCGKNKLILLAQKTEKPEKIKGDFAILEYREKSEDPPQKGKLTFHGFGLTVTRN